MTRLARMSREDLDHLAAMTPMEASLTLREVLGLAPAVCPACGMPAVARERPGTRYVGCCNACGSRLELRAER